MTAHHPVILIVEDEALVRLSAIGMLEDAGFRMIEAANGDEALELLEADSDVQLLFTDINMPGSFNGLAMAHKIFQLRPQVQLILTSGRGALSEAEMPAGGHFLPKPYDCNQLTALIRAA